MLEACDLSSLCSENLSQQGLEASNFTLFWSPGAPPETKPQKCSPAGSPGGSGALPAPPPEAEIDQLSAPRGPQEAPHEFFGPPGRPRAAAKSDLRRSRRPPWAHMAPRSSQHPSGPSFWTLRPPPLGMFHSFSEISGLLFESAHTSLGSAFSHACSSSLYVLGASTL